MVNTSALIPRTIDGLIDRAAWHARICTDHPALDAALIERSLNFVARTAEQSEDFLEIGIELGNLLLTLHMDAESIAAALVYRPLRTGAVTADEVANALGPAVASLAVAVLRMADTSLLEMSNSRMQTSESRDQVENIKRMLVSMIDDPRVAILKLAERVVALRSAKEGPEARRMRIAQEAHLIFAPLASRLGVWQLKWELQDLALRYLAPDIYRTLARQLDGRRVEREAEVAALAEAMQDRLRARGINATVSGRAKHLYSIWLKMRAKNVGLDEVYDVRAIRVVVPDIAQCYSALGVIHTEWQHLPSEFDDYIAAPKENGYRSIHTAVRWDDGKTLEVQIRTPEMHQEAELGVCAHWAYKEEGGEDLSYTQKMNWMRQVVDWQEETRERFRTETIGMELRERVREERIFVYTPKGHVLDLASGATPVDFAYRVHTQIGHRCQAAKVDGRRVALNTELHSGERVEILVGTEDAPRREWLEHHLGFVKSTRAREKISDWFRARPPAESEAAGRALLETALVELALPVPEPQTLQAAIARLGCTGEGDFFRLLAEGDLQLLDVIVLLNSDSDPHSEASPRSGGSSQDGVSLLPGGGNSGVSYTIELLADDRRGLLFDITSYLDHEGIPLLSNAGRVLPETSLASISLEIRLHGIEQLVRILEGLKQIPAVLQARRLETRQ